jgi:hypothetical protein
MRSVTNTAPNPNHSICGRSILAPCFFLVLFVFFQYL